MPQVRIWDVATGEQMVSLSGHKYGINCVVSGNLFSFFRLNEKNIEEELILLDCTIGLDAVWSVKKPTI